MKIKVFGKEKFPLELHKVKIVQSLPYPTLEERYEALKKAGNNLYLVSTNDIFLDMLTDSGVNAMSDKQLGSMMTADDAYAGSQSFYRMKAALETMFGTEYFLPVHQGRAAEHLIAKVLVKEGDIVPMNYHFTTTKQHITALGGKVIECRIEEALNTQSTCLFKGNMDLDRLEELLKDKNNSIAFVRVEAGTNLIGGQPWSIENYIGVSKLCKKYKKILILDASLLQDNLYFIKTREEKYKNKEIVELTKLIASYTDLIYFSARKLGAARGGGIVTNNQKLYEDIRPYVPMYEGFLTYGGMSVREMEATAVGLYETLDFNVISQGPEFIHYAVEELVKRGIPAVTPSGGLGIHLDARRFCPHLNDDDYPANALAVAVYLICSARGMERGRMSEQRNALGIEPRAELELLRLALPRRVFTLSQIKYLVDRLEWLYNHRNLIGGLKWVYEPTVLRFFFGRMEARSDWQDRLVAAFRADLGDEE